MSANNDPQFALPDNFDDCMPVHVEISNRITTALAEVGGSRKPIGWCGSAQDVGRAQALALSSLGIGYSMVSMSEYRQAVIAKFPDGPSPYNKHGLACRTRWWDEAPDAEQAS